MFVEPVSCSIHSDEQAPTAAFGFGDLPTSSSQSSEDKRTIWEKGLIKSPHTMATTLC